MPDTKPRKLAGAARRRVARGVPEVENLRVGQFFKQVIASRHGKESAGSV